MTGPVIGNGQNLASSSWPTVMRSYDGTYDIGFTMRADWSGWLYKRDVATGTVNGTQFNLATITGNPLAMPFTAGDTHFTLMIGLDAEDNVHISGNCHATAWQYTVKNVASWPPSTTWTTPSFASMPWNATGLELHTYSYFLRMSDGTSLMWADQEDSAVAATAGRDFTAWKKAAGAGATAWTAMNGTGEFAITTGPQTLNNGIPDRVYLVAAQLQKRAGAVDRIHMVWIWAKRDPADTFAKSHQFYVYSDDTGATWKAIDGTTMTMPIDWSNYTAAAIPYSTVVPTKSDNNSATMALDSSGYPHFVCENADVSSPRNLEIYWDGAAWQQRGLTATESGATIAPGILNYRGSLWIATTAFNQIRMVEVGSGRRLYLGGPAENGVRPVPCPVGVRDGNTRLTFHVPNGDQPAVYDMAPRTVPTAR